MSERTQPGIQPEWLDLKGLTCYAAVSERILRDWIHRAVDPLPAARIRTKIYVRRTTFDRWLESHPVVPAESLDVTAIADQIISELKGGK
jgi:hypothetical protein